MKYFSHTSVLKDKVIEFLDQEIQNDHTLPLLFSDLTFGGGGHSIEILKRNLNAYMVSFDQDPDALKNGKKLIEKSGLKDRIDLIPSNFCHFSKIFSKNYAGLLMKSGGLSGVIVDLGVSSHHFDEGVRGFSFNKDAKLDMRMNNKDSNIQTAEDIINSYSKDRLSDLFRDFGEEKYHHRIAVAITERKKEKPIKMTLDLANIIKNTYPKKLQYSKINPATKCFQALRIEVNQELKVLTEVIPQIIPFLKLMVK